MRYHFISIGGAVMHNLALDLQVQGHTVTGSDDEIFDPALSRLKKHGLLPEAFGWFPEKLTSDIDAVILGMHARQDNPELLRAKELGLTIYSFPEFIYEQSKHKTRVVIGGSHGKTTTTAMVLHVLKYFNEDFDYLVGSAIEGFDRMVKLSAAPLIILEGDEYLTSPLDPRPKFLVYHATHAQLTGIAWDHINVFPTFESYLDAFKTFINNLPDGAPLAYYEGDKHLEALTAPHKNRLKLLPYRALPHEVERGTTYLVSAGERIALKVFGLHNLQNMSGAKLICNELGINDKEFYEAISQFGGTARRLEKVREEGSFIVFRDFAHSPSKVKATVEAVKAQYPNRKLVAGFELHTFSSLNKEFITEYNQTLAAADEAIVYFNEHVLELKKMPALDIKEVVAGFGGNVKVYTDSDALYSYLKYHSADDTVLLLMSSGNFNNMPLDF